ncbi:hypothetical protein MCUN1_002659 [Malassezia cuniculi]|uniref:Amino acid transporter transmembrane domain-containing protein n=1 Tax=Malassezia cuniculi TaxID=948313 RepID=A0AAF0EWF1_9BASI|nr:hypothetical protein MCUN1_002659 [Malassezia cuniculi]
MSSPPSSESGRSTLPPQSGSAQNAYHVISNMRFMHASKEAQFDADTDSLPDELPDSNGVPRRESHDAGTSFDASGTMRSLAQHWDPEALPDWLRRSAGVFEGTVNMANSILGAGIVGLPYSMRESGFFAGIVLLTGIALLTDWTIRLIVLNAKLSGRSTYIDIMEHCFGVQGKIAVSLFQFVFAFGGMCAFCIVVGDTIPSVLVSVFHSLKGSFLANRRFVIMLCTLAISYPLSLYRNIENLSRASAVALLSMVFIVFAVVFRGPAMPPELTGDPALRFTIVHPKNLVRSISVISFAFVCHHNSLLIYSSLKVPSMDTFRVITHYSTMISAVAALTMSVAGYWSFEDKTLANVLNNFPETDTIVNIARFCFGLNMFTTLPLECFVCREVLETYFFRGEYDKMRHIVLTTGLVLAALIVSLVTCDLGIVLELTGGLSATALAFIFPSICYLKLSSDSIKIERSALYAAIPGDDNIPTDVEDLGSGEHVEAENIDLPLRPGASAQPSGPQHMRKWWESTKILSILCAVFGVIVLFVSIGTAISDTWSGRSGASHSC